MKLVTHPMNETKAADEGQLDEGQLIVWRTNGQPADMAIELAAELTENGERLVVVDAAGCFDPSDKRSECEPGRAKPTMDDRSECEPGRAKPTRNGSRVAAAVVRNLHVIRAVNGSEVLAALGLALEVAREKMPARRVLIAGMLDPLYDRAMPTRDAARALGRMKRALGVLQRSGLEVVVVSSPEQADLGARRCLLASLCAAAGQVRYWHEGRRLTAQQNVDGASAAIA